MIDSDPPFEPPRDSDDSDRPYQPHSHPSPQPHPRPATRSVAPPDSRTRPTNKRSTLRYFEEGRQELEEEEVMEEEAEPVEIFDFLRPKVEFLLWKEEAVPGEMKYLVKWQRRSYHQASWKSEQELMELGYQVTRSSLKSLQNRMRKTLELKLGEGVHFNPSYLEPDRILDSSEVFTAIHHKRANDIKGKWDESLLAVVQKLTNFVKQGYPYGIVLNEPYGQELEEVHAITPSLHLGQVTNKVYLGVYKHSHPFWQEVGTALSNFLTLHPPHKGDFHTLAHTLREAALFLYQQWHSLSRTRHQRLQHPTDMLPEDLPTPPKETPSEEPQQIVPEQPPKQEHVREQSREIPQEAPQEMEVEQAGGEGLRVDIEAEFCRTNIFLTEKVVDPPKNQEELALLDPGPLSFLWLDPLNEDPQLYQAHRYTYLQRRDLEQLDLNSETDKLYFVKWRELSYLEASWESEGKVGPEKVEEFRTHNKIPSKEVREQFEMNSKIHKFLLDYNSSMGERRWSTRNANVEKMEASLYRPQGARGKQGEVRRPREYGGQDIPIFKNYRRLKEFQLESLNWLIDNWHQNRNGILADEMGLGKTVQTIAFLHHLHTCENLIGPFLVLAPLTTLPQWRREVEQWTNFNCLLYYDEGRAEARSLIADYEFYHQHIAKTGGVIPSRLPKFQVLLTNYELFVNDFEVLNRLPFQHVVLDEAHRLKNRDSKTTRTLSRLCCPRKTLLTGTPIQNNTRELWTLLNFIEPRAFRSEEEFLRQYGALSREEEVREFKQMLKPYLLRRVKEDVESSIPRLSETIIDVEMSTRQKTYYRGILEKNKLTMLRSLSSANFNSLSIQLRKCCNHPFLVSPDIEDEVRQGATSAQEETDRFVRASGKTILLMKLLDKFKRQGRKVLLFSQFVMLLDLLKPYLEQQGYDCEVLKGSQSSVTRHQAIRRFTQEQADVFLISTKAGGVGINLTAATEIVIFDSDWNPQNDIQATARAHRIGQKQEVNVYRLITANSYEAEMFRLSSRKLGLDKAIFSGDTFKSAGEGEEPEKQLTKDEMELLLKKGVIGFLEGQPGDEDYFDQPIEDILSKNAHKVEYSVPQSSTNFSKTKFRGEDGSGIQLDAPDFWEQALKRIDSPLDLLVAKGPLLRQYDSLPRQQELMLETLAIVVDLVRQKTQGTGFNYQDERSLQKFLADIYSERHIHRLLRDIADQLSSELEKPSRRFKVRREDILAVGRGEKQPQEPKEQPRKRLTRQNEAEGDLGAISEEEHSALDEDPFVPQEESPKKEESPGKEEDRPEDDLHRLCYLCERPKCTITCTGVCSRAFHKRCFQNLNRGSTVVPESHQLQELNMDLAAWKDSLESGRKCLSCAEKGHVFRCSICLKEGVFEETAPRSRRSSRAKPTITDSQQALYKCSFPGKCSRFYHLGCLYSEEFQNKFSDHCGKPIRDISSVSPEFRCPAHYCNVCYGVDPRSSKTKSYTCIRCCRTYHERCLSEEEFVKLGNQHHHYICSLHLSKPGEAEMLALSIAQLGPSKHEQLLQKRKEIKKKRSNKDDSFWLDQLKERHRNKEVPPKEDKEGHSLRRSKRGKRIESPPPPSVTSAPSRECRSKRNDLEQSPPKQEEPKPAAEDRIFPEPTEASNTLEKELPTPEPGEVVRELPDSKEQSSPLLPEGKESYESIPSLHSTSSRLRSSYKRDDPSLSKSETTRKGKKEHSKPKPPKLQYSDYGLTPISLLDYTTYSHPWCRYCGSRFAASFEAGPWPNSVLCSHHHEQWKKGRLRLDKYKSEPVRPINREKENELRFLNEYAGQHGLTAEEALGKVKEGMGLAPE